MSTKTPAIFISYAHEDNEGTDPARRWLDRLREQLAPLVRQGEIAVCSDKDIKLGDNWHDHIQKHLNGAQAAVLLVSSTFLASEYISNSELPVLLRNAKDRGVKIIPILLRPCLFVESKFKYPDPKTGPEEFSLATLQSAGSPEKTLSEMTESEQDRALLRVAQTLAELANPYKPLDGSPASDSARTVSPTPSASFNVIANIPGSQPSQTIAGAIRRLDGTWSIEREAEREVVEHLRKRHITVVLRGGRQLGKTEIAHRVEQQMESDGWKSVKIDLQIEFADIDYTTGQGFLRRLAEKIADSTHSDQKMLTVFDQDITPSAFKTYVNSLKNSHRDDRLLLRLDRVDALAEQSCCSFVHKGLRVLHNAQCELGEKAWLQILLIHTITPRQTVDSPESIFDVAKIVEVTDFSEDELQRLAELYGLKDIDISKLHSFLGGHPALSQLAFEAMRKGQELDHIIDKCQKRESIFNQYLDRLKLEFRARPNAKELANSFRGLVQGNPLGSEETFDALLALGVIKGTYSGDAEVRCKLYKDWLPPRIPK